MPAELSSLVQDLNRRLESCGFSPERRPFQAHITLARDFTGPAPPAELEHPVIWRTGQVALVESLQTGWGVRYAVLAHWPRAIVGASWLAKGMCSSLPNSRASPLLQTTLAKAQVSVLVAPESVGVLGENEFL
jgi:hypothetical protein